ncbi:hypothetical protein HK102_009386, partial [Quaeritorhiza haematococci]
MYGMATPTSESHIDLNATGSSLSSSATSTTPSLDRKKRIASVSAADGLGIDGAMGLLGGLAAGCDDADDLAAVMMNIASRMHQKNEDRDKENKQLVADLEVAEETIEKQSATIAKLEENWKRAMVVVSSQRDKVDVNRKRIDKIKQSCKLYQLTNKDLERLIKDVEGIKQTDRAGNRSCTSITPQIAPVTTFESERTPTQYEPGIPSIAAAVAPLSSLNAATDAASIATSNYASAVARVGARSTIPSSSVQRTARDLRMTTGDRDLPSQPPGFQRQPAARTVATGIQQDAPPRFRDQGSGGTQPKIQDPSLSAGR